MLYYIIIAGIYFPLVPLCAVINLRGHTMYYYTIFYYIVPRVYYNLYSTAKMEHNEEMYFILIIKEDEHSAEKKEKQGLPH